MQYKCSHLTAENMKLDQGIVQCVQFNLLYSIYNTLIVRSDLCVSGSLYNYIAQHTLV